MNRLAFFKKELMQLAKTHRLVAVTVVFLFFGLFSPLTARYINEILAAVGGGIDLVLPEPSYMDAWGQFFKNISTCMIVFIIMMTGCVAAEKSKGSVLLVLTKRVSRTNFVLSKAVAGMLLFTLAFALAVAGCVYYISVLFPQASYDGVLPALGMSWVQGMFFASFAVFASTVAKTPTSGAILGFAGYAVLSIPTAFPSLGKFTPAGLSNLSIEWIAGTGNTSDAQWGVGIAAVIAVAMLFAAIRVFKRQEL